MEPLHVPPVETRVDASWLASNFPCMQACPVHTEAGRYVAAIADGDDAEAYRIARMPNPFASICGRICAAPCETACRRGAIDQPIAIRALKRFACEKYGVESMVDLDRLREIYTPQQVRYSERVAIIGAGPAGLACAHDLALAGYKTTVFEAQSVPGGMLRLGVPEYRLPRELIRLEVNSILNLGVELQLNKRLGTDFTLESLRADGFAAVFVAIGAHRSRELALQGADYDGVLRAVDFLLNANLGYRVELGERVLVVGGGNVAIDAARMAARQSAPGALPPASVTEALDVARSAVRFGARHVDLVCLESRNEMPAASTEIEEALEERITLYPSRGPLRIVGSNGKVTGLETIDCLSVFDEKHAFSPKFSPGTEKIIAADTVILAIGQQPDLEWVKADSGLVTSRRGTIDVNRDTMATSLPGVFSGGDVAFGPRNAIDAVADGRRASRAIDAYLRGTPAPAPRTTVEISQWGKWDYQPPRRDFEKIERHDIPALPLDRRIGIAQIELGFTEAQAREEASRCLRCWINTTFEPNGEDRGTECIMCGGCADVCPESCITLVPLENIILEDDGVREVVKEEFVEFDEGAEGTVILKDEDRCIRCGLCAARCPVGCITMDAYSFIQDGR